MAYEKRLCVLKQVKRGFSADGAPLSGAVYAERTGSELILTPRIAGIAPVTGGRYAFALWVGGRTFCLEAKGNSPLRVPSAPSLAEGFAVLLSFVGHTGGAEPVAYGCCGSAPGRPEALLQVLMSPPENLFLSAAGSAKQEKLQSLPEPDGGTVYHDEAIAESNYFSAEVQEEAEIAAPSGRSLAYYDKVQKKLDFAFSRYPRNERLAAIFPHSQWVDTEKCALGIIFGEGLPRYLCVATTLQPLPEMREECTFVPTPYSDEEGFYVVFQDADSGEIVRGSRIAEQ